MARVSAKSVRMLSENPAAAIPAQAPSSATGMVTAGISVARAEPRKTKITATTMATAMSSVTTTPRIESRI